MESSCPGSSGSNFKMKLNTQSRKGFLYRSDRLSLMNFDCLEKMYDDKLLCDFVLVAEGIEIHAHKLILASCSAYFYWNFSDDRKLGLLNRMEIQNVSYDLLSAIMSYLYTSEILIDDENVRDLLAAAHMFGLRDLVDACREFLQTNLSPENCIGTRSIAEKYKFEELIPIVDDYVSKQFSQIMRHDEILEMTYDQMSYLLSRERYDSTSDEDVLVCLFHWIRRHPKQRKRHVSSLLKHLQFSVISQVNVLRIIEDEQWLKDDAQLLLEVFKLHTLAVSTTPKLKSGQSNILVAVGSTYEGYLSMEMYDFENQLWVEGPEILQIKSSIVAIQGTTIYHFDQCKMKSINFGCHPSDMVWSEYDGTFTFRMSYGTAVLDGTAYIVGGDGNAYAYTIGREHDECLLTASEKYDTSSRKWTRIASLNRGRKEIGLGALNGNLYAVGGWTDGWHPSDLVECYEPKTDCWHAMPSMAISRYSPGVGVLGDRLFVVGGYGHDGFSKQVECFDPVDRTWSRLHDMNIPRGVPGVIAVNDQLWVIGGYNKQDNYLNSVEIYDPKSDTWSILPSKMNIGKDYVSAILIDNSILEFMEMDKK